MPDREESADLAIVQHLTANLQGCIDIEEYHVENGQCVRDRVRPKSDVVNDLAFAMNRYFDEYGFSGVACDSDGPCPASEEIGYIACYAVSGASEGYYVHVGFVLKGHGVDDTPRYVDLCFGKTLRNRSYAQALATLAARMMGA